MLNLPVLCRSAEPVNVSPGQRSPHRAGHPIHLQFSLHSCWRGFVGHPGPLHSPAHRAAGQFLRVSLVERVLVPPANLAHCCPPYLVQMSHQLVRRSVLAAHFVFLHLQLDCLGNIGLEGVNEVSEILQKHIHYFRSARYIC